MVFAVGIQPGKLKVKATHQVLLYPFLVVLRVLFRVHDLKDNTEEADLV